MTEPQTVILDGEAIGRALVRIAHEIREAHPGLEEVVMVGIRSRGVQLAQRIAGRLGEFAGRAGPLGAIDITPDRDDIDEPSERIEATSADVPFAIDHRVVVLVDVVLSTGRTVRVALDVLAGLGRPRAIEVAVLVDRGNREVPIRADYVGQNVRSGERRVHVRVRELDGADEVTLR